MTTPNIFLSLAGAVADLSKTLSRELRYERLLDAFRNSFPCDGIALLELDGELLVPRAVEGLSRDTLGRRFAVRDHPRFAQILHSVKPVRFAADSVLPDPYDGLIEQASNRLHIHDCMGASLHIEGQPWGIVTLDATIPGAFDVIDLEIFQTFVAVTAATVRASDWIQQLETRLERHHRIQRFNVQKSSEDKLIGQSPTILQLQRETLMIAPSNLPVLILGETGVGKELFAQMIHQHSTRAQEPMVYVNCAALPEALAESELFGHMRGSFSGATDNRIGKFELAHEGTLFLDEVGELSQTVQAKLLRALQNGDIQRVGSDSPHHVDVRIIAATNRDLKSEVAAGRFRADLYHRLSVYPLIVPPLRERGDDALLLAGYFIERNQRQLGLRGARLSRGARQWLTHYSWPGNVRELEHALSRAMVRALSTAQSGDGIIDLTTQHLGADADGTPVQTEPAIKTTGNDTRPLTEAMEHHRREVVRSRLQQYQGNRAATARSLGLDRGNFHRLLKKTGLI